MSGIRWCARRRGCCGCSRHVCCRPLAATHSRPRRATSSSSRGRVRASSGTVSCRSGQSRGAEHSRADATIGLYPAAYPRTDRAALFNAPGKIMKTPADRREQATARYRVDVSEATYAKALAHARRMSADWRRYDLATENCNKVVFEFADRLGLEVRRDMLDLPANIVRGMRRRQRWPLARVVAASEVDSDHRRLIAIKARAQKSASFCSRRREMPVKHDVFEKNSLILLVGILVMVSIGGLVQIAPLFWVDSTIEKVQGMRPYTPLEQAGRDIYIREGCYGCHSQMIRTLRDEVERYGHYSLAAESMYDHPFQWGSKRTGPDLARVGGKYSDQWQADHLINPRALVPESIMPGYPFLATTPLRTDDTVQRLKTLQRVGVPYTEAMLTNADKDLRAQIEPDTRAARELLGRYPKAKVIRLEQRTMDQPTELDALVAYLQILGQMVDFATFDASGPNRR